MGCYKLSAIAPGPSFRSTEKVECYCLRVMFSPLGCRGLGGGAGRVEDGVGRWGGWKGGGWEVGVLISFAYYLPRSDDKVSA